MNPAMRADSRPTRAEDLAPLIPFPVYPRYGVVDEAQGRMLEAAEVALRLQSAALVVDHRDRPGAGLAFVNEGEQESRLLDLKVAHITVLHDAETSTLMGLVATLIDTRTRCCDRGYELLSVVVREEDRVLRQACSMAGLMLADHRCVVVARSRAGSRLRSYHRIRPATPADHDAIARLFRESRFQSQYSHDDALSRRASVLYAHWVEDILQHPEHLCFVYEKGGELLACGAIKPLPLPDTGPASLRILGNGLYAARTAATGAYVSILRALIAAGLPHFDVVQTRVSRCNQSALKVLNGLGHEVLWGDEVYHFLRPAAE